MVIMKGIYMKEEIEFVGIDYGSLNRQQQLMYLNEAVIVAADAFGQNVEEPAFIEDVAGHLRNHRVILSYDNATPVGFVSMRHFNVEGGVLYVSGMAVRENYQSKGVGQRLALQGLHSYRQSGDKIRYIAGRTQNPAVARSRSKYCPVVFPITQEPDRRAYRVAQILHDELGMTSGVERKTLVSREVYSRPLSTRRIVSGDHQIDGFFERNVGPRDAVFIIGVPHVR
jgi:hypothetical protein